MSFNEEYKLFKEKSEGFLSNMGFRDQYEAHKEFLGEMKEIADGTDQMEAELLELRDESIKVMEEIVLMQESILAVFDMPKEHFEKKYKKNVKKADKFVSNTLEEIEAKTNYFTSLNHKASMISEGIDPNQAPYSFSV